MWLPRAFLPTANVAASVAPLSLSHPCFLSVLPLFLFMNLFSGPFGFFLPFLCLLLASFHPAAAAAHHYHCPLLLYLLLLLLLLLHHLPLRLPRFPTFSVSDPEYHQVTQQSPPEILCTCTSTADTTGQVELSLYSSLFSHNVCR